MLVMKKNRNNDEIQAEELPEELKKIIAQRAHNAGLSTIPWSVGGIVVEHTAQGVLEHWIKEIAPEFATNVFDGNHQKIISTGLAALELFFVWQAYDSTKNQQQDWLSKNYKQQYDLSDSLLESTDKLSDNDKRNSSLQAMAWSKYCCGCYVWYRHIGGKTRNITSIQ
jgi:hypothetical protein